MLPDTGLLLAIDTSGADAGVVLADADGPRSLLLPLDGPFARTEDLDLHVGRLLAERGSSVLDVTAVAAVVGPGSYTGLRSGLAFLRGVAFGRQVPAVAIGTLELAAWRAGSAGESVTVVWPTGKGSSLVGTWRCTESDVEQTAEAELVADPELPAHLQRAGGGRPVVAVLHEARRDGASAAFETERVELRASRDPGLERLCALAASRLRSGRTLKTNELLPVYVGLAATRPASAANASTRAAANVAHASRSAE